MPCIDCISASSRCKGLSTTCQVTIQYPDPSDSSCTHDESFSISNRPTSMITPLQKTLTKLARSPHSDQRILPSPRRAPTARPPKLVGSDKANPSTRPQQRIRTQCRSRSEHQHERTLQKGICLFRSTHPTSPFLSICGPIIWTSLKKARPS